MEISSVQKDLRHILSKVSYPKLGAVIGLQEELGKLSKAVIDKEIYKTKKDDLQISLCLADVFFSLIDVCNTYDIEMESIIKKKIEDVKVKVSDWEEQYGTQLKHSRDKLDE